MLYNFSLSSFHIQRKNTLNVLMSNWKDFKSAHVWVIETMIGLVSTTTTKERVCVRLRSGSPMDWSIYPMVSLVLTRVQYDWSRRRYKEKQKRKNHFSQARLHRLPLLGWFLFCWHKLSKNVIVFLSVVLQADGPPCPLEKQGNFTTGVGIFLRWQSYSFPHPLLCDTPHQNQIQESAGSQSLISCQVAYYLALLIKTNHTDLFKQCDRTVELMGTITH